MKKELAQTASSAKAAFLSFGARGARASEVWGSDAPETFGESVAAHSETDTQGSLDGGAQTFAPPREQDAAVESLSPPPIWERLEPSADARMSELREAIGYKAPATRAAELRAEREDRKAAEKEEQRLRELARQRIREQLGSHTQDCARRLEQCVPESAHEIRDAKRLGKLGKHVWAICRLISTGSPRDLAYACARMETLAPVEAVGCWVVEAMGMTSEGVAVRQLHSQKARRKLARSFAQYSAGENTRLRQVAGSPSRRVVRGVYRLPQKLLARITAPGGGGRPWSRATTTRDANEAHIAGLWRRVRMRRELTHESERCGASGQVVSRYWMELPRQPRQQRRTDLPHALDSFFSGLGVSNDSLGWVREQGKQAIVYALQCVTTVRRAAAELACVPRLLEPLQAPSIWDRLEPS